MNSQRGQVSTFAIALLMSVLVIGVGLSVATCSPTTNPEDLPWSNETDVIIIPTPPLPPIFSNFSITPTEIQIGDDLIISFVITNTNNHSITWMSATRIGGFFTQIIEIELESYESKLIWYRIIPHVVGEYDVWIDGMTGTFRVISTTPEPITDETDIANLLEELSLRIDFLSTNLHDLRMELSSLQSVDRTHKEEVEELKSKIDAMETTLETYSTEVNEQIESLENKIFNLQTNIVYACIATAIISILGAFLLIKRMN